MGRTIRTNTSGGGASATTAGLTLDDIENAFFTRRKLQEIKVDSSGTDVIEFTNLDTDKYESFQVRCQRLHMSQQVGYLFFGCMNGSSRVTTQSWSQIGFQGNTAFTSNTSGEMYTAGSNDTFSEADNSGSYKILEFNFYVPDPNSDDSTKRGVTGDFFNYYGLEGGYQTNSTSRCRWFTKLTSDTCNGFYLRTPSGTFSAADGADSFYTIYGTKRRKST